MTEMPERVPTLAEVLRNPEYADRTALMEALVEREDKIADGLRIAGMQLGAMPEFVAKVIADLGLGTPVTPEAHTLINQQFAERLAWLQEEFRRRGGDL